MGYRIQYGPAQPRPKSKGGHTLRLQVLTAIFLLLFLLGVKNHWPAGSNKLRQLLLPDAAAAAAQQAFQVMISDLESGTSFSDSVTAFCQDIVSNAQISE